jgi:hypothetical protein
MQARHGAACLGGRVLGVLLCSGQLAAQRLSSSHSRYQLQGAVLSMALRVLQLLAQSSHLSLELLALCCSRLHLRLHRCSPLLSLSCTLHGFC